jgi:hypothetical protein
MVSVLQRYQDVYRTSVFNEAHVTTRAVSPVATERLADTELSFIEP